MSCIPILVSFVGLAEFGLGNVTLALNESRGVPTELVRAGTGAKHALTVRILVRIVVQFATVAFVIVMTFLSCFVTWRSAEEVILISGSIMSHLIIFAGIVLGYVSRDQMVSTVEKYFIFTRVVLFTITGLVVVFSYYGVNLLTCRKWDTIRIRSNVVIQVEMKKKIHQLAVGLVSFLVALLLCIDLTFLY